MNGIPRNNGKSVWNQFFGSLGRIDTVILNAYFKVVRIGYQTKDRMDAAQNKMKRGM